jgi:hypothetical protein
MPTRVTGARSLQPWTDEGSWEAITAARRAPGRRGAGKEKDADPRVGSRDSPSVPAPAMPGERGVAGGKRMSGRKRALRVDTLGMRRRGGVPPAARSEVVGGPWVGARGEGRPPRLTTRCGDQHERGQWTAAMARDDGGAVETIRPPADAAGFPVLPRRGIVARRVGWLTWYRRLSKDDDTASRGVSPSSMSP